MIADILNKKVLEKSDLITLLSVTKKADIELIRKKADSILLAECGNNVYYRGLLEFSNTCALDCYYCGIRASNKLVTRYTLDEETAITAAHWCANNGYASIVLQSGERQDSSFINLVEKILKRIKKETISDSLPNGLGITLSVGEQTEEVYSRFKEAGAHRYLLRVESTNENIFNSIHPASQTLSARLHALDLLKKTGYQVGTGIMIGLPGQTIEMLVDDLLFFRKFDIDMIGMGPFIPHVDTPMGNSKNILKDKERIDLAFLMIALTRIIMKDVNIAAATALQALNPVGREQSLRFGANIIMPQITPTEMRENYQLYNGKPCLDEGRDECLSCLQHRVESVGRTVGFGTWGDSPHFLNK